MSRLILNENDENSRQRIFSNYSLGNVIARGENHFNRIRSLTTTTNVNNREETNIGWQTLVQHLNIQIEDYQRKSQIDLHQRRFSNQLTTDQNNQSNLFINKDLIASFTTNRFKENQSNNNNNENENEEKDVLITDIHLIPIEQLEQRLHTNLQQGLNHQTIEEHRIQFGMNRLTPPPSPSLLWMLFKQSITGFNGILWIATLFAFLSYEPFGEPNPDITSLGLGVVLILVILSNALFNFYQEVKSLKIVASFSQMQPTIANVRRNGLDMQINAEELLPGDIIQIKIGEKVPADCRLLTCENLQVNSSELTGESEPINCTINSTNINFMETTNLIFYSSLVVQGQGQAIVIHIGDETVLGKVNQLTRGTQQSQLTALHREINRFVLFVVSAALISVFTIWITWLTWLNVKQHGYITLNMNIVNSIGMVVAFIPEGLPAAVTLVLTIVAKKMYQEKVLVKSLATVETFNTLSIIATDKTGTLTMNQMTITALLWGLKQEYLIPIHDQHRNEEMNLNLFEIEENAMNDLLRGACLCNNAKIQQTDSEEKLIGDAADVALYHLCQKKFAINVENIRENYQRINSLPFNSKNKLMITAHLIKNNPNKVLILIKGAPDFLLSKCSTYKQDYGNQLINIDENFLNKIRERQERLCKSGYRVLALIEQILDQNHYENLLEQSNDFNGLPNENYSFIGMFSLLDPSREQVPDAILKAHRAHIRVAMVTGDHPTTAIAIAKQVNIFSKDITLRNGIHSFQIHQINGEIFVNFIENDQTIIEKHPIGELSKSIRSLTMQIFNENANSTKKRSFFPKIYSKIRFYFSDPNERKQIERQTYIPYGIVVNGTDIHFMDDYMWNWVLSHQELVFARTSPEQKLRIVLELMKRGEIVAVTGDGTNDAPALKQAHLGLAMADGTDVSKEAADIILLDNNFSSIIQSIQTGRLLSENLKKVAIYLLPGGSWSEVLPVFLTIWFGIPLSLSAFLAIIFCMLNDVVNSLAMVSEKAERDIMSRPPAIRHQTHLLDWKLLFYAYLILGNLQTFAAYLGFFFYYQSNGIHLNEIFFTYANYSIDPKINKTKDQLDEIQQTGQCIYYVSLCIMQFFNLLSTRTRYESFFTHNPFYGKSKNLTILYGIFFSTFICLFVTLIPWFNSIFKTKPVPILFLCPAIFLGLTLFTLDELRKLFIRRYPNSFLAKIAW